MTQTLNGSREAYGLLVVRHSRTVRASCIARVGVCDDLDDMVQEAFVRAYQGLHRLKDPRRFGAYAHRIAQHICADKLRRRDREPVSLDAIELQPTRDAPAPADEREDRLERLRRAVGRLPVALREAILLFYFDRRSHAECAAVLGISEAAVNQRLHRARQSLRQSFGISAERGR